MRKTLTLLLLMSASAPVWSADPGNGEKLAAPCAACHGPGGVSQNPAFPSLAGQYRDYLENAIAQYQNGQRKNVIMSAQATNLSKDDIADLAAYFAAQPGPLFTPRIR